jgi:hypothetical protein
MSISQKTKIRVILKIFTVKTEEMVCQTERNTVTIEDQTIRDLRGRISK